jgi:hypothetical protein
MVLYINHIKTKILIVARNIYISIPNSHDNDLSIPFQRSMGQIKLQVVTVKNVKYDTNVPIKVN